jgi:hypothetical protein
VSRSDTLTLLATGPSHLGRVDPDGIERVTTQDVSAPLPPAGRLAKVMRKLNWTRCGCTRGGYLEPVQHQACTVPRQSCVAI